MTLILDAYTWISTHHSHLLLIRCSFEASAAVDGHKRALAIAECKLTEANEDNKDTFKDY